MRLIETDIRTVHADAKLWIFPPFLHSFLTELKLERF